MENDPNSTREGLKKDLEDYIDTRMDVMKLKIIEKAGFAASGVVTGISLSFIGYFFLLFLTLTAAFALSALFESYTLGFACIAAFFGIVGTLIFVLREKLITFPIINALLKKFYYNKT